MSGELVAVYGSLMTGLALPDQPPLEDHLEHVGPCRMRGVLYDLGAYPCLVTTADGEGEVRGELWRTKSPDALALLDIYEGEGYRYERRRVRLLEPDVDAWTYVYAGDTGGLSRVAGGDWREWLATRDTS